MIPKGGYRSSEKIMLQGDLNRPARGEKTMSVHASFFRDLSIGCERRTHSFRAWVSWASQTADAVAWQFDRRGGGRRIFEHRVQREFRTHFGIKRPCGFGPW
jgi:hypothetical protein